MRMHFEDFEIGQTFELGSRTLSKEEMLAFANDFDAQPFHVDEEAAKNSMYGGLIASGWHTASMVMRLMVEHYLSPKASLGSPGIDELRWLKPVYPGNQLHVRTTVLDCKRSRSKTDRGIIITLIEVLNQEKEMVMSFKATNYMLINPDPR